MKKILFSIIFALFGILCVTGSVFLLTGCSQSTPENGGGDETTDTSPLPDDDKESDANSDFDFTVYSVTYTSDSSYSMSSTVGSVGGYFSAWWYANDGSSARWGNATTKTSVAASGCTCSGLGTNDNYLHYASYFRYVWGISWVKRYMCIEPTALSGYTSYGTSNDLSKDGAVEDMSARSKGEVSGQWYAITGKRYVYNTSKITIYASTAQSNCSTKLSGTIYCIFRKNYTATYYANGGTGAPAAQTFCAGKSYTMSSTVPTRNGYTFAGWTRGTTGTTLFQPGYVFSDTWASANDDWYAKWTPNTYKVTLNANGGSGGTSAVWFKYGTNTYYSDSSCTTTITAITRPTRTGYTYNSSKGFYTASAVNGASAGERYIAYDSVSFASDLCTDIYSNVTLICEWTINTYRLSINYYSSATNRSQLTTTATTCNVADETLSAPTTNSSYTFTYITHTFANVAQSITFKLNSAGSYSYYLKIGSAPTTTSYDKLFTSATDTYTYSWFPKINSTINLYVYQRYQISYNLNYGSGTLPSAQYKIHGTSITLGTNSLTRTSFTADGWNTSSSGTATNYASGAIYSDDTASRTLYADWTPRTCTINVKIMTSTNGSTYTNSTAGGSISVKYTYNLSPSVYTSTPTVTFSSASWTASDVLISQIVNFINPTPNSGYVFAGVSTSTTAPYTTKTLSYTPTTQGSTYTYYVYFNKCSSNIVKYVSKNSATYSSVSVTNPSGYAFKQNSAGFWESQNWGIHSSYALAKVSFTLTNTADVVFDVINYAESSCDFGIFSNLNTTLTSSYSADTTNVKQSFSGKQTANVQSVLYENTAPGTYYIYVKYRKDGSVNTNNDSLQFKLATEISDYSYYYVEDGYFPQSYVGDSLNSTLTSTANKTLDRNLKYLDASGNTIQIPIYTYNSEKYAMVTNNGETKWFKVEKIRWRISDYDGNVSSEWIGRGKFKTNFKVVSDKVLWVGAVTRDSTTEGWSFNSSDMRTNFNKLYVDDNGNTAEDEIPTFPATCSEMYYYYGEAGQQEKVDWSRESYSGINIATEEEILTYLTDLRARASDMVAFILGLNDDSYCTYWTRELGGSLRNGKAITSSGITRSAWLQNFYGVRFSLRMSEGTRV